MDEKNNSAATDKVAIASLVAGIASVFLWSFSIFPLLALVLGVIGITRTGDKVKGRGMAIAGTVLGVLFLLVRLTQG
jgi:Domain of unknown function (DUF4190)